MAECRSPRPCRWSPGFPQLLVRKQAKTYGTAKLAEGPGFSGRRVLVVEDVTTTGGQVVASTSALRAGGALIDAVICVVDRRASVAQTPDPLAAAGLSVLSLFTLPESLSNLFGKAGQLQSHARTRRVSTALATDGRRAEGC